MHNALGEGGPNARHRRRRAVAAGGVQAVAQAEAPAGIVQGPRRHVDHDEAGKGRKALALQHRPRHCRTHGPAHQQHTLKVARRQEVGAGVGGSLDRQRRSGGARQAVPRQIGRQQVKAARKVAELRVEKAAVAAPAVQQQDRRACARLAEVEGAHAARPRSRPTMPAGKK